MQFIDNETKIISLGKDFSVKLWDLEARKQIPAKGKQSCRAQGRKTSSTHYRA